jgi:hypothetical protein
MTAATLVAAHSLGTVRARAGLFKLDFCTAANSGAGVTLTNWDSCGSWSFTDFTNGLPAWKLTDYSTDNNTNVTLTIMDNAPLNAQFGFAPATGMSVANRTPIGLAVIYDGIDVPAVVKDHYSYLEPDAAGAELLFRFANLNPGRYNVTVFDGRPSDDNGQYGKIWGMISTACTRPPNKTPATFLELMSKAARACWTSRETRKRLRWTSVPAIIFGTRTWKTTKAVSAA